MSPRHPPTTPRWHAELSLAAHAAARYRDGAVWSGEVGSAVAWRGLFVRLGYQPATRWDLQGRPIELSGLPVALGWRPRLLGDRRLAIEGIVALAAERLALRRLDQPDATTHAFWQLGFAAGARLQLGLYRRLRLGLGLEASWMPGGRKVQIPQGPGEVLDRFGFRAGIDLGWGGADG